MKQSPDASAPHVPPTKVGAQPGADVVLVHGLTEDRKGLRVLRARQDRVELGEVRPVTHGMPLHGDIVRLHPRPDAPQLCDVVTEFSMNEAATGATPASEPAVGHAGPARVATKAYRDNWDTVYGRPAAGSSALN